MIIVCGRGILASLIKKHLRKSGTEHRAVEDDYDEEALLAAGIGGASVLIACDESDEINAFLLLTAKSIKPEIFAIAISSTAGNIDKLYRAGADYVVASSVFGGKLLAKYAIEPYAAETMTKITIASDVEIAEISLSPSSPLVGQSIAGYGVRKRTGVSVIAVRRGESIIPNPGGDFVFKEGDGVIVLGGSSQISEIARAASGRIVGEK